jgi:hypothetical protein
MELETKEKNNGKERNKKNVLYLIALIPCSHLLMHNTHPIIELEN